MKLDLSQWNPFKFFRKAPEEKAAASTTSTALAVPGEHEWPTRAEAMRRLMQDMLQDTPWRALASSTAGLATLARAALSHASMWSIRAQPVSNRRIARHGARGCGANSGRRRARAAWREKGGSAERGSGVLSAGARLWPFSAADPAARRGGCGQGGGDVCEGVLTIQVPKAATEKPRGRRLDRREPSTPGDGCRITGPSPQAQNKA